MRQLQAIAEELNRRQRMDVRYHDGELTIPIDGEDITVSEDNEHDRLVLWAEVARNTSRDGLTAAEISLLYNEQFAVERAVTLGVSPEADCAILGRSMEPVDLDAMRLLSEARSFRVELLAARTFFQDAFAKARDAAAGGSSGFSGTTENYLKI